MKKKIDFIKILEKAIYRQLADIDALEEALSFAEDCRDIANAEYFKAELTEAYEALESSQQYYINLKIA